LHFKLDDHGFCWVAKVILPSWTGYLGHNRQYGRAGLDKSSDGSAELVFAPEGRDTRPLAEHEVTLVDWFLDNERAVSKAAKAAIFQKYPELQEIYGYSNQEKAELMPDISSADDLTHLIGLNSVNIHQIAKDDIPYIGLEFGCSWDDEHGLGVLMHGTRPVEVGGGDTACLLWIAKRDSANG
jgi:hypothetical protein